MRKIIFLLSFFILNNLIIHTVSGQNNKIKNNFNLKDFEKNKIYDQTYNLWKYKNMVIPNKNDTIIHSYFVDDRNYKGLINYGLQFRSKDFRTFNFIEGHHMFFLKVDFEKVKFNPKDSIIEIEGHISGGWGDFAQKELIEKGIGNRIDVFLGEKTDTIKNLCYNRVVNQEFIEAKLNGVEVSENTILDTFPAFYFKNYTHFRTLPKGKRYFKIKGKVKNNTFLVFGGHNCYSEVFDLGTMVYYPNKNKRKKIKKKEAAAYKTLIVNNELLSEKGKDKVKEINYYTYTEEAENYILKRQYAKAKEQYIALEKKYPVIFARDIHNAIRCALFSRDYENTFYWSEKMAKKGVSINYFNAKIFQTLKRNGKWKIFSSRYDSIYKESHNSINYKFKEELEKLLHEDQADYGLSNRKEPKVLYDTTERVTDKLIALLNEEGFPSEEKIGVYTKKDTVLDPYPEYHVLIRHAIQQNPKNIEFLNDLLTKSIQKLEYDSKRSSINLFYNNSCFHIYKGNLYNSKSCGSNDLMVRKMKFIFNNPNGFFIHTDNYVISEYNKENPEDYDKFYNDNFNLVMKLTDNWEFYEK
ncbi:hypothetical protein [Flavobacterium sp.]|uniref:hypothetical protein n=1 Tax=Flavobacterium sp. TaxID=239 RepID=UPI0028BD215D|nr:hypothetical protein [Flavobacterium sp.]